eukprot:TRINITY_DN4249_c0_g2_i1.p1 TRINITY_DN4249_c0_g2~~TRINITY_DN4249_c0_g2_i1.p1  ORF type:complete len:383 (-),score=61.64 TRINITY_DN4249_c0_g2_i1:243-1391(-)
MAATTTINQYYFLEYAIVLLVLVNLLVSSAVVIWTHWLASPDQRRDLLGLKDPIKPLQKFYGRMLLAVTFLFSIYSIDPFGLFHILEPLVLMFVKDWTGLILFIGFLKWVSTITKVVLELAGSRFVTNRFKLWTFYVPSAFSLIVIIVSDYLKIVTDRIFYNFIWMFSVDAQVYLGLVLCIFAKYEMNRSRKLMKGKILRGTESALVQSTRTPSAMALTTSTSNSFIAPTQSQQSARAQAKSAERLLSFSIFFFLCIAVSLTFFGIYEFYIENQTIAQTQHADPEHFKPYLLGLVFLFAYCLLIYAALVGMDFRIVMKALWERLTECECLNFNNQTSLLTSERNIEINVLSTDKIRPLLSLSERQETRVERENSSDWILFTQ